MNYDILKRIVIVECCLLIPTFGALYRFLLINHNLMEFEVLSAFHVLAFFGIFPWIFKEYIDNEYGILSEIHMFSTYQYQRVLFLVWFIALMYIIIICSHMLGFLSKGFLCSIFFVIPVISLLFGTEIYNDSSCIVDDEILLGYPPIYPVISLIVGIFGFSFILNSNFNHAFVLFITLIFQLILVLPHVINRFVPFEIRTKKGCLYFLVSCIVIYALLIFLSIGGNMLNSSDSILNPERILKNILVYCGGMILVILFYRQAKQMNEKKK
ncbi:hypothetical protein [Methanobrevibacter sp.]|uniref:hypothetical protein n=1 Tax=Methanobrevibacter sp. TaxID=66852 RepID=UPI003890478D